MDRLIINSRYQVKLETKK